METGGVGIIPQMEVATKKWKSLGRDLQLLSQTGPARLSLSWSWTDAAVQAPALVTSGLLAKDVNWDPVKKVQTPTKSVLAHTNVMQAMKLLKEQLVLPEVAHRFHSIGNLDDAPKKPTTTFLLTIFQECEERARPRVALKAFTDLSAMGLIGARIRSAPSHRPLPKELQDLLGQGRSRKRRPGKSDSTAPAQMIFTSAVGGMEPLPRGIPFDDFRKNSKDYEPRFGPRASNMGAAKSEPTPVHREPAGEARVPNGQSSVANWLRGRGRDSRVSRGRNKIPSPAMGLVGCSMLCSIILRICAI